MRESKEAAIKTGVNNSQNRSTSTQSPKTRTSHSKRQREGSAEPSFLSFFMAGFECTFALMEDGRRLDLLAASRHDEYVDRDYKMLLSLGIRTVREGLSWSQIDQRSGRCDFSRFVPMMRAARALGIQQIWDLNHFDYPSDVDPFGPDFALRYSEYARRAIERIRKYSDGTVYLVPMNEPSFFAWMCDQGLWAPYKIGAGFEFKRQLVRAAIAAMDAIWEEDRNVRFIHADPLMNRSPMRVRSKADHAFCDRFNRDVRFQSWDMIAGHVEPELGGDPKYLDIIGINYYFHNQQFVRVGEDGEPSFKTISLGNPKRLPLSDVLREVEQRYGRPIVITETGSYRGRRPRWWQYVLGEVERSIGRGINLHGVCSYPTLDIKRGAGFVLPNSGLWDFDQKDHTCRRIPHRETLRVISRYSHLSKGPH